MKNTLQDSCTWRQGRATAGLLCACCCWQLGNGHAHVAGCQHAVQYICAGSICLWLQGGELSQQQQQRRQKAHAGSSTGPRGGCICAGIASSTTDGSRVVSARRAGLLTLLLSRALVLQVIMQLVQGPVDGVQAYRQPRLFDVSNHILQLLGFQANNLQESIVVRWHSCWGRRGAVLHTAA